jgi:SAM-dependent methyltransferase
MWEWDPTLFEGTATHYRRGRLPYAPALPAAVRDALALDSRGRLLDVGCGPGTVALALAPLFEAVVGLDPDQAMLDEAATHAAAGGVATATWICLRAEALPADLGTFRVASFGQSFHWMQRDQVAAAIFGMLEPGGAFLHVSQEPCCAVPADDGPRPPYDRITRLVQSYLGEVRRAGQGLLPRGTPGNEAPIIESAGFDKEQTVRLPGGASVVRSVEDVLAWVLSRSESAPHLFADRLPHFQHELLLLLTHTAQGGAFRDQQPDTVLRIWLKPRR